ncbi:MAG: hypothetical protein AB7K09_09410 [Planctomycetota bacterium]
MNSLALLALLSAPPAASPIVTVGIAGIAITMALLLAVALWRTKSASLPLAVGVIVGWMALWAGLAAAGVFSDFASMPPRPAMIFIGTIAGGLALGLSSWGRQIALRVPLWGLILAQGFRLPLELVMHQAADEGTMPHVMTFWPGLNQDIVTGTTAIIVALLVWRGAPRWLALAWNILGLVLLGVIAVVAFAASPMVRAWGDDQVNTWVVHPPFVWLPTVLVLIALAGHIVVFRRLRADRASAKSVTAS